LRKAGTGMVIRRKTLLTVIVAIAIILAGILAVARLQAYRRQVIDSRTRAAEEEALRAQAEKMFPPVSTADPAASGSQGGAGTPAVNSAGGFFARTRLSRDRARSQEMDLLRQILDDQGTDDATRSKASQRWLELTTQISQEASIEGLLLAKGFPEAVVMLDGGGAVVVVQAATLDKIQVAQVADIVYRIAGVAPEKVSVINRP